MKVFMLRNAASHFGCSLREKETGTVSDQLGNRLLAAGIAVRIDEPLPPVIQTVPPPPAIAEAKPPEIMPDASKDWQSATLPMRENGSVILVRREDEPIATPPPSIAVETKPTIVETVTTQKETIVPKPAAVSPVRTPVLPVKKIKHKEF